MVIEVRNTGQHRRRVYWIVALIVGVLLLKYGSKYVYLYIHHKECLAHYLRKSNFSQNIEDIGPYEGSESLCYEFVKYNHDMVRDMKQDAFKNAEIQTMTDRCIKDKFDKYDSMKEAAYFTLILLIEDDTEKFEKHKIEEYQYLKSSELNATNLRNIIFLYDCHLEEKLHSDFEMFCGAAKKTINPVVVSEAKSCFAEYLMNVPGYNQLVEKQIWLPELRISTCDSDYVKPLINVVKNAFYHKSILVFKEFPKFRECLMQKAEDTLVINKLVNISMLGLLGMDEDTKKKEFKMYSDLLEKFKSSLYSDCLKRNEY